MVLATTPRFPSTDRSVNHQSIIQSINRTSAARSRTHRRIHTAQARAHPRQSTHPPPASPSPLRAPKTLRAAEIGRFCSQPPASQPANQRRRRSGHFTRPPSLLRSRTRAVLHPSNEHRTTARLHHCTTASPPHRRTAAASARTHALHHHHHYHLHHHQLLPPASPRSHARRLPPSAVAPRRALTPCCCRIPYIVGSTRSTLSNSPTLSCPCRPAPTLALSPRPSSHPPILRNGVKSMHPRRPPPVKRLRHAAPVSYTHL